MWLTLAISQGYPLKINAYNYYGLLKRSSLIIRKLQLISLTKHTVYIKYKSLVYVLLVIETWSSDKCKTQKSKNGGTKGSSINDLTHFWHLYFWHFFAPPPSPYYVTFNVRTPLPPVTKQKHF